MPSSPRELLLSTLDEMDGPCDLTPTAPSAIGSSGELGSELTTLASTLSDGEAAGALLALSEHATVLRLIWEAHVRGAVALPPTLARRVVQARRSMPAYLGLTSPVTFASSPVSKRSDELSF
jgi:hypothetical protein